MPGLGLNQMNCCCSLVAHSVQTSGKCHKAHRWRTLVRQAWSLKRAAHRGRTVSHRSSPQRKRCIGVIQLPNWGRILKERESRAPASRIIRTATHISHRGRSIRGCCHKPTGALAHSDPPRARTSARVPPPPEARLRGRTRFYPLDPARTTAEVATRLLWLKLRYLKVIVALSDLQPYTSLAPARDPYCSIATANTSREDNSSAFYTDCVVLLTGDATCHFAPFRPDLYLRNLCELPSFYIPTSSKPALCHI